MRQTSRALLALAVALAFITTFSLLSYGQTAQPFLTRHVPEPVLNGKAQLVGALPANQTMRFDIVIPLRDQPGLDLFLQDLYNPASPFYHLFITPEEFTARFGASEQDWEALVNFAKASGFQIFSGTRDERDLRVTGTVANIEKAFHVALGVYQHPTENRTFFSPDREPSVDLPFPLWHVSGLDNYITKRSMLVNKYDYAKKHGMNPDEVVKPDATTGSGPSASFLGSDMRHAYYCNGTCGSGALTGTGQTVGLFEYEGTDLSDLTLYYKNAGQTEPFTPTIISVDGTSTTSSDDIEQTLDMTQAMGMAPGITMLYMYVGSTDTAILSAMVATADAPLSKQIGCSWGWTADVSTLNPYFEQMGTQDQNFFAASGDSGYWHGTGNSAPWPADDAYLVGVGGTDLTTSSAAGPWATETSWSDSGGGITTNSVPIPSWQQLSGVINSSNAGSTTLRNGPDVSANANFTFYTCGGGSCTANEEGGTSFAAPMWAGYLALANQQAAANGEVIGFINPTIYPANLTSSYGTYFHDITSGSSNGKYSPETGFDLITGWGSPNGSGLINLLAPAAGGTTPQTITVTPAPPSSAAYQSTFGVAATASSGLAVAITTSGSCTGSGTSSATITMSSGTGTCSVIFNQAGNATYAAAPTVTDTTTATTLSQTISWTTAPPASAAYYSTFNVAATASSGLAVTIAGSGECSGSGSSGSATITMNATSGTCTVTASQAGSTNYSAATSLTPTVSATQATQTITFTTNPPSSEVYNGNFTVAATATSSLAVTYTSSGSCSNSGATYTMTSGTGTCSVIANQSGNTYYSAATPVTKTVNATLASQTITFTTNPPSSEVYNGNFTVAATGGASGNSVVFTSSGSCSNSGATYTMTSGTGTCSVTANQAGNTNYAAATPVTKTVNATLAPQTITFTTPAPASAEYGSSFIV
ncbi:MAG: protease pro-enzyme activation domain-containing protein, partial [Terriglobales bacterium]